MHDTCSANCSNPRGYIPEYADISGIGVVIGYVSTAGLAIIVVTLYFLLVYRPDVDPFAGHKGKTTSSFRVNALDMMLLEWRNRLQKPHISFEKPSRHAHVLIKCMLLMSDMQTLAGFSILLSAALQLRCGLSAFHWQVVVYLAWFSGLTHLACLTFLRGYLYHRRGQRIWRLGVMGIIAVMLLLALLPTGNYAWDDETGNGDKDTYKSDVQPTAYAVCHLKPKPSYSVDFLSMVFSVLLLAFAYLARIVRLNRGLSNKIIARPREKMSKKCRSVLQDMYAKSQGDKWNEMLRREFIYRPMLGVFLAFRILFDLWSSMAIEIYWLLASFVWGAYRLHNTRTIDGGAHLDGKNEAWTFGQVIPMVMLIAPIVTFLEYKFGKYWITENIRCKATHTLADPDHEKEEHGEISNQTLSSSRPAESIYALDTISHTPTTTPPNASTGDLPTHNAPSPSVPPLNENPDHAFSSEPWFRVASLSSAIGIPLFGTLLMFVPTYPANFRPSKQLGLPAVFQVANLIHIPHIILSIAETVVLNIQVEIYITRLTQFLQRRRGCSYDVTHTFGPLKHTRTHNHNGTEMRISIGRSAVVFSEKWVLRFLLVGYGTYPFWMGTLLPFYGLSVYHGAMWAIWAFWRGISVLARVKGWKSNN